MRNHELSLHVPKVDSTLAAVVIIFLINNIVFEDYTIRRQMVISFKVLHTSFTYYIKSSSKSRVPKLSNFKHL